MILYTCRNDKQNKIENGIHKMKNFDYAITKKTKRKFRISRIEWKEYSIHPLALPLALVYIPYDRAKKKYRENLEYDITKAKKVLDYWLPYVLEADGDDTLWYCGNWHHNGYSMCHHLPIGYRIFAQKFGRDILDYLEDDYTKDGWNKSIEDNGYDKWIRFDRIINNS